MSMFTALGTIVRMLQTYGGIPPKEAQSLAEALDELQPYETEAELLADTSRDDSVVGYAEDTGNHFLRQLGSWQKAYAGTTLPVVSEIVDGTGDTYVRIASGEVRFGSGGSQRGVIDADGRWGINGAVVSNAMAVFYPLATTEAALTIRALAAQTGDVMKWETSGGGVVAAMDQNGGFQPSKVLMRSGGSQGAPVFTANADPDTGVYFPSANVLGFTTGGSEAVRIDALGRMGIGTLIPSYTLDVAGSARFTGQATVESNLLFTASATFVAPTGTTNFVGFQAYSGAQVGTTVGLALWGRNHSNTARRGAFSLLAGTLGADVATNVCYVAGVNAQPGAATNQDGGQLALDGGDHATGGGVRGAVNIGPTPSAGDDPSKATLADYFDYISKDLVVGVGGSPVASVDLGWDLPAGAMLIGAALNIQTAITGAGGCTAIGLGLSGDEDKYAETAALTQNAKATETVKKGGGSPTALAASEDLKIYATDGAGSPTGTIQNGSVRVRVVYAIQTALPDAA